MSPRERIQAVTRMLGRAGAALTAVAVAIVPPPTTSLPTISPIPAAASVSSSCWQPKDEEVGFLRATNQARTNESEGSLNLDPELSKVARLHTREMASQDLLYHTNQNDMMHRVTGWTTLGENVGVGGSVDSLSDAFMNSPPHRANILHASFKHVGIGVKEVNGRMWVTVIFESNNDPGTPLRMPHC